MLKKNLNISSLFISSLFFIFLGISFLYATERTFDRIINASIIIIGLINFINIINNFLKKENKKYIVIILQIILNIVFTIILINFSHLFPVGITFLYGLYLLFMALIDLINLFIYLTNNIKGKLKIFFRFLFSFDLSLILMLSPSSVRISGILLGLYFLFLGISDFITCVGEINKIHFNNKFKLSLPLFIAAFIPSFLIDEINKDIKNNKVDLLNEIVKNDHVPNLFILIHLAQSGTASLGHVEISINNKVYSYSNYDMHSRKLFGAIGDGVIGISDKNKYINFNVHQLDRYLVEFGIYASNTEITKIENKLNKILTNTTPYYSDYKLYKKGLISKRPFNDLSSRLERVVGTTYHKINKGPTKKYFVFKSNCTLLAESVLNSIGIKISILNGILAPGTYYEHLNNLFLQNNSKVISRTIYTKENTKF